MNLPHAIELKLNEYRKRRHEETGKRPFRDTAISELLAKALAGVEPAPAATDGYREQSLMVCVYCGVCLSRNTETVDHFVPKSKGGVGRKNKVRSCEDCNKIKADLLFENVVDARKYITAVRVLRRKYSR